MRREIGLIGRGRKGGQGEGKSEEEAAPSSQFALDIDRSTVKLDQMFDDGESESSPLNAGLGAGMHLVKFVEDSRECFRWDATASVGDTEDDRLFADGRRDGYLAPVGRELDRIGDEVDQDVLNASGITVEIGQEGADLIAEDDTRLGRDRQQLFEHRLDNRSWSDRFSMKFHHARLDLGEIEEIIDQTAQPAGLGSDLPDMLRLFGGQIAINPSLEHLCNPADDGQRSAQFVGYHREEGVLHAIQFTQLRVGFGESVIHRQDLFLGLLDGAREGLFHLGQSTAQKVPLPSKLVDLFCRSHGSLFPSGVLPLPSGTF
jgi:hypothetical protein